MKSGPCGEIPRNGEGGRRRAAEGAASDAVRRQRQAMERNRFPEAPMSIPMVFAGVFSGGAAPTGDSASADSVVGVYLTSTLEWPGRQTRN